MFNEKKAWFTKNGNDDFDVPWDVLMRWKCVS